MSNARQNLKKNKKYGIIKVIQWLNAGRENFHAENSKHIFYYDSPYYGWIVIWLFFLGR